MTHSPSAQQRRAQPIPKEFRSTELKDSLAAESNRNRNLDAAPTEQEDGPSRPPRPRIYVASLSDDTAGPLYGQWIDAARPPADIGADIGAMLARSMEPGSDEFVIHDFSDFGSWRVNEYDSIEHVSRIARGIAEYGYAFAAWADVDESDPEHFDDLEAAYLGHFDSPEAYAKQLCDECDFTAELATLPTSLQPYISIDYAALARDLEAEGALYLNPDPNGGYWLFDGNI